MAGEPRCAACGGGPLGVRWRPASEIGSEGLIPTTTSFGAALGDIVRCAACGHMQVDPMPSEETLDREYAHAASEDYVDEQDGQRETARRVLAQVERFVAPGRIADLGCWTGFLLDEARRRGWDSLGVEPSTFAATYAREQLGLTVLQAPILQAQLDAGEFAAVVMGDVIEHLPAPSAALDRARAALAPHGVLCLMLPDAGSAAARLLGRRWWSVLPTHVQYFTRASMLALLQRSGWQALHLDTQPKAFSVGYYLGRIGGYSGPAARLLTGAARRAGVADRRWAPDLRDRMLVIARPAST